MHHLPFRRALLCILLSSIPVVQNSIQPFCDGSLPSSLTWQWNMPHWSTIITIDEEKKIQLKKRKNSPNCEKLWRVDDKILQPGSYTGY